MQLRTRVTFFFALSTMVFILVVLLGLPYFFTRLIKSQMENHARTYAAFIRMELEDLPSHNRTKFDEASRPDFEHALSGIFESAVEVGGESGGFVVNSIRLLDPSGSPIVSYPGGESKHALLGRNEIESAMKTRGIMIFRESKKTGSMDDSTIDLLAKAEPFPGTEYAIAIRLDFTRSMQLHSSEYTRYELIATLAAVLIELFQAIVLLRLLAKAALRPVGLISMAMESVAQGHLDTHIDHNSEDEFGKMAERFNEMTQSLKEKQMLSLYVSRSTIDMVQSSVSKGSSFKEPFRTRRTVFFSDIRGFTHFSEANEPEVVIRILNRILDIQAAVITNSGGKIDKFVGDEIMATFESPRAAALCSLKIANLLAKAGKEYNGLQVGIGISEGEVVEGDVGIESHKDFTVIGDVVNIAARLQGLAAPGKVLAPMGIMELPEMGIFRFERAGLFEIKGKQEKLAVARLLGIKPEAHRRK